MLEGGPTELWINTLESKAILRWLIFLVKEYVFVLFDGNQK